MQKQEFYDRIMVPLMEEFGYVLVFNGRKAEAAGLELRGSLGRSYISRKGKPCVITWHRNLNETFQLTFHEIAHSVLHGKGSGFKAGKSIKEIEAESVAKRACDLLGIPYRAHFKREPGVNYIEHFQSRYLHRCAALGVQPKVPRYEEIEKVAQRIASVLRGRVTAR